MKNLLDNISVCSNQETVQMNPGGLKELLFPPFKKVKDCIIISDKDIDRLEVMFDRAIKMNVDRTGYEAGSSETRINCYFENEISMETGTAIALIVLEAWALQLKSIEPDSKFCLILCSDENYVEIRFHKIHENEIMWLDEELENYGDGAIGYAII